MLFPLNIDKPKRPAQDRRLRRRIPTGIPRLVESSRDRRNRSSTEAWDALLEAVRRSASARLELLRGRDASDRMQCSWQRLSGCETTCRCRGAGTVTVGFLRDHYERLALELSLLARRSP